MRWVVEKQHRLIPSGNITSAPPRKPGCFLPVAIAVAAFLLGGAAHAAEFHVGDQPDEYEDLSDDPRHDGCQVRDRRAGLCTLRAAIEESNRTPEHDRIVLYRGGVFELTRGQLTIANSVTIVGIGAAPIIDAESSSRVIAICNPERVSSGRCEGRLAPTFHGHRPPQVHLQM